MNPYQHGAVAGEPHPNPALTVGAAVERSAGSCSRPSCKRGARQEGTCIAHSPRTRAYLRERIAELSERQLLARGVG